MHATVLVWRMAYLTWPPCKTHIVYVRRVLQGRQAATQDSATDQDPVQDPGQDAGQDTTTEETSAGLCRAVVLYWHRVFCMRL